MIAKKVLIAYNNSTEFFCNFGSLSLQCGYVVCNNSKGVVFKEDAMLSGGAKELALL